MKKFYLMLIIAMAFWGGSWVSADILVEIAPPMTIGFFRFLFASLLFIVLMYATGSPVHKVYDRDNLPIVFAAGLTGVFGYGVFFLIGMGLTTAAQGAIIAGFNPTTVSVAAFFIHKERLSRRWQYVGFLVSFSGVIFVVGVQALIQFNLEYFIGNLIILCAMCMWGLYSSIGKQAMKKISALEITAGGSMVGTVFFGLAALFEQPWTLISNFDHVFWSQTIFLGVFVTFVGFLFYFISINELGATKSGVFINLVPVFGVISSFLFLQEPIYWTFIVGLLLVITGVTIINFPAGNKPSKDGLVQKPA